MEQSHKHIESDERLSDQPGAEGFREYLLEPFRLTGAKVLSILNDHRDYAEMLKNRLPADMSLQFGRLFSARNFTDSPYYAEMEKRIDDVARLNKVSVETHLQKFVPKILSGIKEEGQMLSLDLENKLTERLKKTKLFFFDLYRFFALIAEEKLEVDVEGAYYVSRDVVLLSPVAPSNPTLLRMWETNGDFQQTYIAIATTHECLHAAGDRNFLLVGQEQAGKKALKFISQLPQISGLEVFDNDRAPAFTWLNEGVTSLLTKRIFERKFLTGDEEFDGLVSLQLQKYYEDYQKMVIELLKVIPEKILLGAFFDRSRRPELEEKIKEKTGLPLKELDRAVMSAANPLNKLKRILAKQKKTTN
jgi:hypothetical protein